MPLFKIDYDQVALFRTVHPRDGSRLNYEYARNHASRWARA